MSDKNRQNEEPNKQEAQIEDLPVEQSQQDEVKGGVPHLIRIIE
jgi:hypothetical protein